MFDAYLVEMGVDEPMPPKNMEYLLTILHPDIGVILNALSVHTQQFGSVTAIAKEKGKLVTQNPNLQYAILNADQPEIATLKPKNEAKTIMFGKDKKSEVIIKSITSSFDGTSISFHAQRPGLTTAASPGLIRFKNLVLPEFYGHTVASALAVASALNINLQEAADTISKNFKLPPGRGRIFEGIKNTIIIDSSYNASGTTMRGSLEMLKDIGKNRVKIAILGDMRELGSQAEIEHKKVAESAIKSADKIILVGPQMEQYALPITKKSKIPVEWFATAGQAKVFLEGSHPSMPEFLTGGEIILVKGSQNTIFLEIVVEALLINKSDVENLCRRGKFWKKKRITYQ
jgi:UDP-N-acetylmuramoyl-tripeptide--D-alanyl-D-alanine ligase